MSAHPLHSPPPLMLPVTASYDLIISENSLICPCPPSYPSSRLSKDSDSGAFCSEGGRGWLCWSLLSHLHTFPPFFLTISSTTSSMIILELFSNPQYWQYWQYLIPDSNLCVIYQNFTITLILMWNNIFGWVCWGCNSYHLKNQNCPSQGKSNPLPYVCPGIGSLCRLCLNVFET